MTDNNSTNDYAAFLFDSDLKIVLILDHDTLDERGKIFCVTTYLETKSFKIDSK